MADSVESPRHRELVIYADESVRRGPIFSSFFGGALVRSTDLAEVRARLAGCKAELGLKNELKWQRVTSQYVDRYEAIARCFFSLVREDKVKVRIFFTRTAWAPVTLTRYHREHEYFLLYYQFIKHAFGLRHSNETRSPLSLRLNFDMFPETREKARRFKEHIRSLSHSQEFRRAKIFIRPDGINEVDSRDHDVMQCLDVVLGAIQFQLNKEYKGESGKRIGNRKAAKRALYRTIAQEIGLVYPNFNIGITTGLEGSKTNYWRHSYRHWLFRSRDFDAQNEKSR